MKINVFSVLDWYSVIDVEINCHQKMYHSVIVAEVLLTHSIPHLYLNKLNREIQGRGKNRMAKPLRI
jgi:hypothetical protein